jgi:hypothetical protein
MNWRSPFYLSTWEGAFSQSEWEVVKKASRILRVPMYHDNSESPGYIVAGSLDGHWSILSTIENEYYFHRLEKLCNLLMRGLTEYLSELGDTVSFKKGEVVLEFNCGNDSVKRMKTDKIRALYILSNRVLELNQNFE